MALIKAFFNERCLFEKNVKDPHIIMNIKTGMIAPQNVNVNVVGVRTLGRKTLGRKTLGS